MIHVGTMQEQAGKIGAAGLSRPIPEDALTLWIQRPGAKPAEPGLALIVGV